MYPVFIAGGSGYLGSRLAQVLAQQGCAVNCLTRNASVSRLPSGVTPILGNALDEATFAQQVPPKSVYVHLVGVPHPAPWKERAFREVDLASLRASVAAARAAACTRFVYVSVAHPAPVMAAYIRVRKECESILAHSGLPCSILRPWYVLGPGHRWPVVLQPLYSLAERFGKTRESARRLGLVRVEEMVAALTQAATGESEKSWDVWDVPRIRDAYATTGSVRNRARIDGSAACNRVVQ